MESGLNTIIAFKNHKISEQINLPDVKDKDMDMVVEHYKAYFQQSVVDDNIVMIKKNGYPILFKNDFMYIEQYCEGKFNTKDYQKSSLILVYNNHNDVLKYNILLPNFFNKNNDIFVGIKNFYLMSNYTKKYVMFFTDMQKVLIVNLEKFDVVNIKKRTESKDKIKGTKK